MYKDKYYNSLEVLYAAANNPELYEHYKRLQGFIKRANNVGKVEYAVYSPDDELLMIGSAGECAEYLGVSVGHIYHICSRTKKGVFKSTHYKLCRVVDDEDE